ncbi:MAG TPA: hypothetical protein VGG92_13065 [Caulobacteraceae bacterium]
MDLALAPNRTSLWMAWSTKTITPARLYAGSEVNLVAQSENGSIIEGSVSLALVHRDDWARQLGRRLTDQLKAHADAKVHVPIFIGTAHR